MFPINANPIFPAVCKLTRLGAEIPGELTVEFRHLGGRAHDAWLASAKGSTDVDFLDQVLVSWNAVDAQGQPVPYSKQALDKLLDEYPCAGREIFACYEAERLESRTGN